MNVATLFSFMPIFQYLQGWGKTENITLALSSNYKIDWEQENLKKITIRKAYRNLSLTAFLCDIYALWRSALDCFMLVMSLLIFNTDMFNKVFLKELETFQKQCGEIYKKKQIKFFSDNTLRKMFSSSNRYYWPQFQNCALLSNDRRAEKKFSCLLELREPLNSLSNKKNFGICRTAR